MTEPVAEGFITSYVGLFRERDNGLPPIRAIEIPLIQRDYAQGRDEPRVKDILTNFLHSLRTALMTGESLSLDFVYGEVDDHAIFRPLDGQQRLTTLFLLHWYLANRVNQLDQEGGWKSFSYATRPGARAFCERLSGTQAPVTESQISEWIIDQSWYRYDWRHDPTIKSMLTVLNAIQAMFDTDDADQCLAAWQRLVGPQPAIQFHVLLLGDTDTGADLYIKMNSRGRPLTEYETFKAGLEASVEWASPERHRALASKLDGSWSDLLWKVSNDDLVDDDFVKYFGFITETCEWLQGQSPTGRLGERADLVFGNGNAAASKNLDLLDHCFDTWLDPEGRPIDVDAYFESHLRLVDDARTEINEDRLPLFGARDVHLLRFCCHAFGVMRGDTRVFSLGDSLLLYAILLHRRDDTSDFPRRLRVLRNLIEASSDELSPKRGPDHIEDVNRLILHGTAKAITSLNKRQVADEERKREFLARHPAVAPALFRLEDHSILRGNLSCFPLDPESFETRAQTFEAVMRPEYWHSLTGALLSKGEYGRDMSNGYFRLGSPSVAGRWRGLLTEANDTDSARNRTTMVAVLDELAIGSGELNDRLHAMSKNWLAQCEATQLFDWRYYMVRYDAMRDGNSGFYYSPSGRMGYDLCMLSGETTNGRHRDPYLDAIVRTSGVAQAVEDAWFRYRGERWLGLKGSGITLRVVDQGFEVRSPDSTDKDVVAWHALMLELGGINQSEDTWLVPVAQAERNGVFIDTEDRVQFGAKILRDLVSAEL